MAHEVFTIPSPYRCPEVHIENYLNCKNSANRKKYKMKKPFFKQLLTNVRTSFAVGFGLH